MRTALRRYYANPDVHARMLEFLGGASLHDATCAFITADSVSPDVQFVPRPVDELWHCLDAELDVGRSLWDRRSLIVHLDLEYVNFDFPAEPYLEPTRAFELQQPVVQAIRDMLGTRGIVPLHLLSGRGHHFVWRLRRESSAFASLARVGHVPESLEARYGQPLPPHGDVIEADLGAAYAGLGLVMEYFGHRIMKVSAGQCDVPVALTAVEDGPGDRGREIVSIDLSEYGDPLHTRGIRMPFSTYSKPDQQRHVLGEDVAAHLPPLFLIPLQEMGELDGLCVMRNRGEVAELAQRACVTIPDQSEGMKSLIGDYERSDLARFHGVFYRAHHDPPEWWPDTYDRTPLETLPPCARRLLEQPNDRLLKPAGLQHVVRVLLAVGWHPRHIAGLIRSKFERDFGWGEMWYRYDASTRADFYTRMFAGLIATGRDELVDFNCRSCQEKQYCPAAPCGSNLTDFRAALLARRNV